MNLLLNFINSKVYISLPGEIILLYLELKFQRSKISKEFKISENYNS